VDGVVSPIGRTRTLAEGAPELVRLALTSCSNYPHGYYNAYAAIAARDDLDAVVHLGDYIYEYANGAYGDGTALARIPDPVHECLTLDDYRKRHATYKHDPDLQAAHRQHAFIAVWDDHEIANDAWLHGAANHQADEGDWETRRAAAMRAYHEWMPIRDGEDPAAIWRRFEYGDLVDLLMLDTRHAGRDAILPASQADAIADPARQLLGVAQERWLLDALAESRTIWRVLAQQTRMTQLRTGDGELGSMHPWDGYPAARDRILAQL
jgi:alkaline phosphatase D